MPNYEDFKKYGEMEKQKKPRDPAPDKTPRESWLNRTLAALKGSREK